MEAVKRLVSFSLISMLLSTQVLAAGGKVAVVKMMRGKVSVEVDGKVKALKKGDWIEEGQVVKTQKKSFVKLVFIDKSSVNVGPDSEMKVEKFSKKEAGLLNLVKGKIRSKVTKDYLEMSKGQKSKLYLKSPGAVMGIRGTDFLFTYSQKTKASSAVLFEGSVYFSKLRENERPKYDDMERYVERDNIRIKPGEFSVAARGTKSATIPAVLNVKQREVLEKNENFSNDNRGPASNSSSTAKSKVSVVPPGLSGKIVANDNSELKKEVSKVAAPAARGPASEGHSPGSPDKKAPIGGGKAEGFIANSGAIKPANGSLVHLGTGTIIAPPEDSQFDPTTNSYIPTEEAGTVSNSGEYVPPENIVYKEQTGEFIQVVDLNGQTVEKVIKPADVVMPAEPIAHHKNGPGGTAGDPIVGMAPPPPPPANDIYNGQFNPDGLNDFQNNNNNIGFNPNAGQIIRARVGFDFTIQ